HQVALADPADGGIAAHRPDRLDAVCQQQGARARARRGQRGLGAGIAAADHVVVVAMEVVMHPAIISRDAVSPASRRKVGTQAATTLGAPGMATPRGAWPEIGTGLAKRIPGKRRGRTSGDVRPRFFWAGGAWRPAGPGKGADARRERNRGDPGSPAGCRHWSPRITSGSDASGQSALACDG